ncbi:MAG: type II secretion system protein [Burkholderiales bacterium]|jgi:hypothetical protein
MHLSLRRWRQQGTSQLELVVSLVLIAIFVIVLLERTLYYQEYAEMTAMEMTVANMRSGLRYKVADLIMNNRMSEIATLADENPITWLSSQPENYLGEYDSAPGAVTQGKWFYDRTAHELVYTLNHWRHFVPSGGDDFTVRYRCMPIKPDQKGDTKSANQQTWVTLAQLQSYRWLR